MALSLVGRDVTFNREVSPILIKNCVPCHRPGDIGPMPLISFQDAQPMAASIAEAVAQRRMPPWPADPNFGKFANDPRLTDKEIQTIRTWVQQGAKEGNAADLPQSSTKSSDIWRLGKPDALFSAEEVAIPAESPDQVDSFTIATGFKEDRWIRAVDLLPSNRAIVADAQVSVITIEGRNIHKGLPNYIGAEAPVVDDGCTASESATQTLPDNTGLLGLYRPGKAADSYAEGSGKLLPAGAQLLFRIHYANNTGVAATDRTQVGLYFAAAPPQHMLQRLEVSNNLFRIPAGSANHEVRQCHTFENNVLLLSYSPHMHSRGKDMRIELQRADGSRETLLWVPHYNAHFQRAYRLQTPLPAAKGDRLIVTAHFDNSENNQANPDSTKAVRWGESNRDEVMEAWLEYIDSPSSAHTVSTGR